MGQARNAAPKNLRARLEIFRRHLASAFKPTHLFYTDAGKQTAAQLIAALDAALKPYQAVDAQRDLLASALLARKQAEPTTQELASRTVNAIRTAHSSLDPRLKSQFLRYPGGLHVQSSGQKFNANLKRQRSRKLTGVLGKRQRAAKLKGG